MRVGKAQMKSVKVKSVQKRLTSKTSLYVPYKMYLIESIYSRIYFFKYHRNISHKKKQ